MGELELERKTGTQRAEQRKQVEIARQEMAVAIAIAIANKSREQRDADAAASKARAEVITIEAKARQAAALAEAEGKKALNEALNTLSAAQVDLQVRSLLLQQLPDIIEMAAKPMEKIDSICIFQVGGIPGAANPAVGGSGSSGATFPEQARNSTLQYQLPKPSVDAVMKDAWLSNEGITGVAQALSGMMGRPAR